MNYTVDTNEYKVSITEVLYILKYLPNSLTSNIPTNFLNFLNNNSIPDYNPDFDLSKGLDNVKLKNKTKILLAIIYREYICSEQERSDYNKILTQNENEYQIKLKEKYNINDIFNETKKEKPSDATTTTNNNNNNNNKLVIYKKSYFTRIKDLIKKIFNK